MDGIRRRDLKGDNCLGRRHLIETQDRASVFGAGNIRIEPYWDAIRDDPGFKALLAKPPEPAK